MELLDGVDDLDAAIRDFGPTPDRRLGILVDHLVPGTKESAIVDQVRRRPDYGRCVTVLGHPYVDVWQSVKPARLGWSQWPQIPRSVSYTHLDVYKRQS